MYPATPSAISVSRGKHFSPGTTGDPVFSSSSSFRDEHRVPSARPPPSFPTHENILQKLLRDQSMRSGRALGGRTVKPAVDGVELRAELAPHVEPPVADEDCLAELRAVRTEKRCLSAVYVAIMPRLASRLYVGEEAGEGLVVAVEIRVGHLPQHRVIRAWSTCNCNGRRKSYVQYKSVQIFQECFNRNYQINKINIILYIFF